MERKKENNQPFGASESLFTDNLETEYRIRPLLQGKNTYAVITENTTYNVKMPLTTSEILNVLLVVNMK